MSVEWKGEAVLAIVRKSAMIGVLRGTEKVLQTAVAKIQNPPKTGRLYTRRGITHQASAPGQSPATDTGRLVQSGRTEFDQPRLTGRVIFSTAYAEGLELGTQTIAPRPFLRPALNESLEFIQEAVRAEIAAGLSK